MVNLYNENDTKNFKTDLEYRVYTSQLLGKNDELVLHGGGNTSVKSVVDNMEVLYVKGSGWDLATIEPEGFPAVELQFLKDMARLEELSDSDMVDAQRKAMLDQTAPNPSIEAILHAIIPFKYVDHTHADAIVTITNNKHGKENIEKIFPNFLVVDYIMPGFILAHTIYKLTRDLEWDRCEGIILLNHGIFTFDDDPKLSYDKMIDAVTHAENFLDNHAPLAIQEYKPKTTFDIESLQKIISDAKGYEVVCKINQSPLALHYASQENIKDIATKGVLTPEHIIRTKRVPLILEDNDIQKAVDNYKDEYIAYYEQHKSDEMCLNPAPNWAVVKNFGTVSFGKNEKEASVIEDVNNHTIKAVLKAELLGGFESISFKDSFDMEYWELEQIKLKK
jgi:rhamnose utilization protein RhaD (predicted bifunctional aldolase and dehydrogenase)